MPVIEIRNWTGSLIRTLDPDQAVPGDFHVLENFIYSWVGLPIVRGARRKWGDTLTDPIYGLYFFQANWIGQESRNWLMAQAGESIFKTEQDGQWDEIYSGLETGLVSSWASFRGWLIWASESSVSPRPLYWDGMSSAMKPLRGAPRGYLIASHANRLWVVDSEDRSKLWYSAPFNPEGWLASQGAGFLEISPGDGNEISALVPGWAGEMIVFKDGPRGGATHRIQGTSLTTFTVAQFSSTLGAIGSQCATLVGDRDVIFASRRGIHSLQRVMQYGDLASSFVDSEASTIWRSLDDRAKRNAVAVDDFTRDSWWLFFDSDGDGANDRAAVFNYKFRTPRGNCKLSEVTFGASSACVFREAQRGTQYLMTGNLDGWCRLENTPDSMDDGTTPVAWRADLYQIDSGDGFSVKSWIDFWLRFTSWGDGEAVLSWYGDNHPPSSKSISLNPLGFPTPSSGGAVLGEMRSHPDWRQCMDNAILNEGGVRIYISLSGDRGRIELRGFRLGCDVLRPDVNADVWIPYRTSRDGTKWR